MQGCQYMWVGASRPNSNSRTRVQVFVNGRAKPRPLPPGKKTIFRKNVTKVDATCMANPHVKKNQFFWKNVTKIDATWMANPCVKKKQILGQMCPKLMLLVKSAHVNFGRFQHLHPPLVTPTTQYHGIMDYMRFFWKKCMTRFLLVLLYYNIIYIMLPNVLESPK